MRQEASFADVPSDIMIDIFTRLPVKTIITCKCVCKSWLNFLTSPEFVKCHLSTSKPSLVFSQYEYDDKIPSLYHAVELESYNAITAFGLMEFSGCREDTRMRLHSSVDGLMFCCMTSKSSYSYYICNPITRDYIELPRPQGEPFQLYEYCGLGVSKTNGQYKLVRIYFDGHFICEVYTLGTRSWRTVPIARTDVAPYFIYSTKGTFLNGNLHWLAKDFGGRYWILCFDLETELLSQFSTPTPVRRSVRRSFWDLIASGNCLHLLENGLDAEAFVWTMKEYGVAESWTKECVISRFWCSDGKPYIVSRFINIFSNGDILFESCGCGRLLYYSSKSETGRVVRISELLSLEANYTGMLHSPSFLSLKSFVMEDVKLLHSGGSISKQ